ncbi:MAG: hypothetical protein ACUZ8E_07140 [Candidatus Anammoxibacter sp.]
MKESENIDYTFLIEEAKKRSHDYFLKGKYEEALKCQNVRVELIEEFRKSTLK